MARNFLTGLRLANLTSDPAIGSEGELYYNTVTDKIRLYSNGQWIDVVAASSGSLFNTDIIAYPDYITFDTTPENTTASVGTISWNNGESLLDVQISTNTTIDLGQTGVALSYNAEATTLNKGEVVYLFGAQGQRPSVKRAANGSDATSAKTFGVAAENIAAGAEGFIVTQGIVKNIDTNAYNEGDVLWLGSSAGTYTTTKPYAPSHGVFVGVVVKKNASSGRIYVKPQNGYEMDELHNVYAQSPSNNDILVYTSASTMWVAKNLATAITAVDGSGSNIDADLLDGQHGSYYAPINSPALTGTPTSTTASVDTNTTQIATTAYVVGQGYLKSSTASSTYAPINSPTFTGTSTFPTLLLTTADTATAASHYIIETASDGIIRPKTLANVRTEIVTTAAVNSASATVLGTVTSGVWQGSSISATYIDSAIARLASPALSGTPTAPTAAVDTNTTQIATTAFVLAQASSVNPSAIGTVAIGSSTRYARADHVHPTTGLLRSDITAAGSSYVTHDFNSYPNLYSHTFINATGSTNVPSAIGSSMSYRFVMGSGDVGSRGFDLLGFTSGLLIRERSIGTWWTVWHTGNQATLFTSPALTGTPTAPTASAGTNTTQIATTAYVTTAVASSGGTTINEFFLAGL